MPKIPVNRFYILAFLKQVAPTALHMLWLWKSWLFEQGIPRCMCFVIFSSVLISILADILKFLVIPTPRTGTSKNPGHPSGLVTYKFVFHHS